MRFDRSVLVGSLAIAVFAAACGGSSATATTAPAGTAAAATSGPAGTSGAPQISLNPGSGGDLEAMLPSSVNGVTFTKTGWSGGTLPPTLPIGGDQLTQFLQANGKTLADLSFAMAVPTDPTKAGNYVMAFRVNGADATKLAEALGVSSGSNLAPATVGGKQVLQAGAAGMGATIYTKNDTVFYIIAIGDASLTNAIVAALP